MTGYHEWLAKKRREAFSNFEAQRGFRPEWPPVDTIKPGKYDEPTVREEPKSFDRRRIIFSTLTDCERTFECYTKMLADPFGAHNREHFLDWMGYANDRYAKALKLAHTLEQTKPSQISIIGGLFP